jgi:hypothetical protein
VAVVRAIEIHMTIDPQPDMFPRGAPTPQDAGALSLMFAAVTGALAVVVAV